MSRDGRFLSPDCDPDRPSTWASFRPRLCEGCAAGCCTLPVEVSAEDLLRMELASSDELRGSLKKVARRLMRAGIVRSFRARSGLFTLEQKLDANNVSVCRYLDERRRCTIYDRRPDVCRRFPQIGPRPGYCPYQPIK